MRIADIEKEIERIQNQQFMNAMNDHWSESDYDFDRKCTARLKELRAELATLKGEANV